jgi:hypothetical protein
MIREVMDSADEKMFADTDGEIRIMLNRDPSIKKEKKKDGK